MKNKPVIKTCQFYAVGKNESELLAYDEYDSLGNGEYFTEDVLMCERVFAQNAEAVAKEKGLKVFLVTITKTDNSYQIDVDEM